MFVIVLLLRAKHLRMFPSKSKHFSMTCCFSHNSHFFFLFNLLHSIQKIFIIWQVLNDGYLQQQSGWSCDFNMAVPMSRASRIFPKRRMKAQDIITFSLTCAYVIGSIFMYYIKFGLVG